jgi:heme O synthase-like polyprenyltransferase
VIRIRWVVYQSSGRWTTAGSRTLDVSGIFFAVRTTLAISMLTGRCTVSSPVGVLATTFCTSVLSGRASIASWVYERKFDVLTYRFPPTVTAKASPRQLLALTDPPVSLS